MGNVGKMYSSPGYTAYHSFAQEAESQEESNSKGTEEQSNNENDQESFPHERESANGTHISIIPIEKSNILDIFDLQPQKRKSATTSVNKGGIATGQGLGCAISQLALQVKSSVTGK
jgi:hypothetical protein